MEAFNTLVNRWQDRIHRLAYRYFGCYDDAVEITQRTFIRVYQKINSLEEPSKFSSWIYRISHNLCLDEAKRAGRKRSEPMEILENQPVTNGRADHSIQHSELSSKLQQALKQLPAEQRIVIILKQYQELKFREIAEILHEPEGTVKSRMYYGLNSLKDIFNQQNIKMEELI